MRELNRLHDNQCDHDIYLGSDNKSDFYLYVSNRDGSVCICRRFGIDGDYSTMMFSPSISNSNGHQLLEKLKDIIEWGPD